MNFLQLCQRLRQETGISDSGPSNVSGQTGDMKRLVDWVNESWVRIQGSAPNWSWMWTQGEVIVPATQKTFSLNADLIEGTIYCDGKSLLLVDYPAFREATRIHPVDSLISRLPSGDYILGSVGDVDRAIAYEAYRHPAGMTEGIDVPTMPEPYHMIIVWAALQEYAIFDEAPELIQKARLNYEQLLAELSRNTLPQFEVAGPLA